MVGKVSIIVDSGWCVNMYYCGMLFNTDAWADFIEEHGNKEVYAHEFGEEEDEEKKGNS